MSKYTDLVAIDEYQTLGSGRQPIPQSLLWITKNFLHVVNGQKVFQEKWSHRRFEMLRSLVRIKVECRNKERVQFLLKD